MEVKAMVRVEEIQKKVQDRFESGEFALYIRDEDGIIAGFEEIESITYDGDRYDVVLDTEIVIEKLYSEYRSKFFDGISLRLKNLSSRLKEFPSSELYYSYLKVGELVGEKMGITDYKKEEIELNAFLNNHLWNRAGDIFISTSWEDIFLEFYHDERLLLLHFPARSKIVGYIMPEGFTIQQLYYDLRSQFLSEVYISSLKSSFLLI